MFRNYFIITLRNLFKNGFYSFINIVGLAIGITSSILILLWVADEMSFDKFHPKADRLYQVWVNATFNGEINSWTSVPLPTYEAMKTADSNIERAVVTDWGGDHLVAIGDGERRLIKKAYWVSEEFLEMFEFSLLQGDPAQALDDPRSVIISESMGKALFGDEDPMNQVIKVDNEHELKVTGILKDIPAMYRLPYQEIKSMEGFGEKSMEKITLNARAL